VTPACLWLSTQSEHAQQRLGEVHKRRPSPLKFHGAGQGSLEESVLEVGLKRQHGDTCGRPCNPSTWDDEAGGSYVQSQLGPHSKTLTQKKKAKVEPAPVAHACNLSYSGGRDQEDRGWKPAQANSL
jgi:hypothetical protein